MSESTLQMRINAKKTLYLQKLKEQGVYIQHCRKRGFVYEIIQTVSGQITRLTIAIKNGLLYLLSMEPVRETAA